MGRSRVSNSVNPSAAKSTRAVSLDGYDPMDPATQQDPFPYYEALRNEAPVYRGPKGIFFVSRHDAVIEVLREPNLFSSQWGNTAGPPRIPGADEELAEIFADAYTYMKSGTLMRQVINRLNQDIDFNDSKKRHALG